MEILGCYENESHLVVDKVSNSLLPLADLFSFLISNRTRMVMRLDDQEDTRMTGNWCGNLEAFHISTHYYWLLCCSYPAFLEARYKENVVNTEIY